MNLSPAQIHNTAEALRHVVRTLGVIPVSRVDDPEAFERILSGWSDDRVIMQIAGYPDEPLQATSSSVPESDDVADRLRKKWREEGASAFRSGVARDALPGGRNSLRSQQVGWDQAKAESDAPPVPDLAAIQTTEQQPVD